MTGDQPPSSLGFPSSLPEPHRTRTRAICRNPWAADECTAVSSQSSDWSSDCLNPIGTSFLESAFPIPPAGWKEFWAPFSCRATARGAGVLLRKRTLSPACGFSFLLLFTVVLMLPLQILSACASQNKNATNLNLPPGLFPLFEDKMSVNEARTTATKAGRSCQRAKWVPRTRRGHGAYDFKAKLTGTLKR